MKNLWYAPLGTQPSASENSKRSSFTRRVSGSVMFSLTGLSIFGGRGTVSAHEARRFAIVHTICGNIEMPMAKPGGKPTEKTYHHLLLNALLTPAAIKDRFAINFSSPPVERLAFGVSGRPEVVAEPFGVLGFVGLSRKASIKGFFFESPGIIRCLVSSGRTRRLLALPAQELRHRITKEFVEVHLSCWCCVRSIRCVYCASKIPASQSSIAVSIDYLRCPPIKVLNK